MPSSPRLIIVATFFTALVLFFSGCDVARQARQVSNLAKCDFRIASVDHVNLAGVELQYIKSVSDLGFADVARVLAGFASPVFPLSLQLNLDVRNPNAAEAGLNRLEWILFIDDIQMTSGIVDKPFTVPPMTTAKIPVDVGLDLKQVLNGKSATAMLNFCMNLAGAGNTPTRFKIKLKPTVIIAGTAITFPGFINVNTTYTSK
ncbi:MAG: LEA type 2 family protein [Bacteroidetes bacterium]|nr:LEA type 2 family protein [Bacteroidota bacterium]